MFLRNYSKYTLFSGGFEYKNCKYFLGTTQNIRFSVVVLGTKTANVS
jgi:hypothetical protein